MSRVLALMILLATAAGCAGFPCCKATKPQQRQTSYSFNVRNFGAIPNDSNDDTAAIQKALLAARGNYYNGRSASGATVFLPAGEYLVQGLEVFTGTTLRGEGNGSFLKCTTSRPAISIKSHFTHGGSAFVAIENLSIAAALGCCIQSKGETVNSRFENLALSSNHVCMQFDGYTQNCFIHNIAIAETGSGALRITGNANRIDRIDTEGGPTPNYDFLPAKAMIEINGDGNEISGCIIEGGYHGIPLAIKGGLNHYRNNWIEFDTKPDKVALLLEDAWMCDFDRVSAGPDELIRMRNCRGLRFGELWMGGEKLRGCFDLDQQTSGVQIDTVNCPHDAGGMDDPQIHVQSYFSRLAKQLIPNPPFRGSDNWVVPMRLDEKAWAVQWQDGAPISASIEPKPDHTGKRLRIEIAQNPTNANFSVRVPLQTPPDFVGSTPFAAWRAQSPPDQNMIVYYQGAEFATRATGSLTAARFPRPIAAGGELSMTFHHAKPGTYYISDVRVGL